MNILLLLPNVADMNILAGRSILLFFGAYLFTWKHAQDVKIAMYVHTELGEETMIPWKYAPKNSIFDRLPCK